MINFESQFFQKTQFSKEQIEMFIDSAKHDINIAESYKAPEVVFKFSYDALIKIGIAALANSGYKIRSCPGHHSKVLEKLSAILGDEEIADFGNKMRRDRNADLYCTGFIATGIESNECLDFAKQVLAKFESNIK